MTRCFAILCLVLFAVAGCASSSQSDPRDKALSDPMNYNPAGTDRSDISGGGILDFNGRSFKKDVNDVLSP